MFQHKNAISNKQQAKTRSIDLLFFISFFHLECIFIFGSLVMLTLSVEYYFEGRGREKERTEQIKLKKSKRFSK